MIGIRRWCIVAVVLVTLGGCSGVNEQNAGFTLSMGEAKATLDEMHENRRPFQRPVIVLGGYFEPSFLTDRLASVLRRVATEDSIVVSTGFLGETDFDGCLERVDRLVERTWPGTRDGPIEVDVVGFSMGGLVARLCAIHREDSAIRVVRIFTISTPHRGAKLANFAAFDDLARDMRSNSEFLQWLDAEWQDDPVEIRAYTRLNDGVVGAANTMGPDGTVWWVSSVWFSPSHRGAMTDARIVADIARHLRGEVPLTGATPMPVPGTVDHEHPTSADLVH